MLGLKELLAARAMSQKQLAISLGVSQPIVSEWVSGKKHPSGAKLVKMAEVLGVTVEVLLSSSPYSPIDAGRTDKKKEPTAAHGELLLALEARPILQDIAHLLVQLDDSQLVTLFAMIKGLTGQP